MPCLAQAVHVQCHKTGTNYIEIDSGMQARQSYYRMLFVVRSPFS